MPISARQLITQRGRSLTRKPPKGSSPVTRVRDLVASAHKLSAYREGPRLGVVNASAASPLTRSDRALSPRRQSVDRLQKGPWRAAHFKVILQAYFYRPQTVLRSISQ